jgi:polysaccharide deacetylase 2 family uncharacterized protein YibQ
MPAPHLDMRPMPANDLNNPLRRKLRPRSRRPSVIAPTIIAIAVVLAVVAAVWIAVVDDPDGGEPVAVASIQDAAPATTGSIPVAPPDMVAEARQPGADSDGALTESAVFSPSSASADPGLIELTAYGPLPRISPDGRRPRTAYAGHAVAAGEGAPRVAIVVGGLGLSQTGTQEAIASLPAAVTLAFAPYGSSLQRWVDKARTDGHEVLLQVPLEPMDFPRANPGEHTLLVGDRQKSGDDLAWNLTRVTSYAGVMNYMGARFTSDENAMGSMLGELGARGLFYLDDGSSPESRAAAVGSTLKVPVLVADRTVDSERSPEAIRRALSALEDTARSRGFAVGVASAFPSSIQALADWAKGAAARGIVLVPASAGIAD